MFVMLSRINRRVEIAFLHEGVLNSYDVTNIGVQYDLVSKGTVLFDTDETDVSIKYIMDKLSELFCIVPRRKNPDSGF